MRKITKELTDKEKREKEEIKELKRLHKQLTEPLTDKYLKSKRIKQHKTKKTEINYCPASQVIDDLQNIIREYGDVELLCDLDVSENPITYFYVGETLEETRKRILKERKFLSARYTALKKLYPEVKLK